MKARTTTVLYIQTPQSKEYDTADKKWLKIDHKTDNPLILSTISQNTTFLLERFRFHFPE